MNWKDKNHVAIFIFRYWRWNNIVIVQKQYKKPTTRSLFNLKSSLTTRGRHKHSTARAPLEAYNNLQGCLWLYSQDFNKAQCTGCAIALIAVQQYLQCRENSVGNLFTESSWISKAWKGWGIRWALIGEPIRSWRISHILWGTQINKQHGRQLSEASQAESSLFYFVIASVV